MGGMYFYSQYQDYEIRLIEEEKQLLKEKEKAEHDYYQKQQKREKWINDLIRDENGENTRFYTYTGIVSIKVDVIGTGKKTKHIQQDKLSFSNGMKDSEPMYMDGTEKALQEFTKHNQLTINQMYEFTYKNGVLIKIEE